MALKLEVGKAYKDRNGEVCDCVELTIVDGHPDGAWCVNRTDGHRGLFRLDGNYTFSDMETCMDLVEEA